MGTLITATSLEINSRIATAVSGKVDTSSLATVAFTGAYADIVSKPATFAPTIGSTSTTAVAGNDARLTDARTPTDGSVTNVKVNSAAAISADKLADGTTNKIMTATERTKLSGIATGATANSSDATLLARANHTGTQTADTITDGTTNKAYTATEKSKLSGIATGATANSTDATLLSRANHTGTQLSSTISDFGTAVKTNNATLDVEIQIFQSGGTYVRPNYAGPVLFVGSSAPAIRTDGVTTGGDNQAVQGLDSWLQTA